MIYNFNMSIGWISNGVEYAQAYRAKVLRNIGQEARFIFLDMISSENIARITEDMGFLDREIIWLYTFFTNCRTSPVTYTLGQLERSLGTGKFAFFKKGNIVKYTFPGKENFCIAYLENGEKEYVRQAEFISNGRLIRKDYYTYCRIYSEYYAPVGQKAHLYQRRFFQEDGSVAYEEILDGDSVLYCFPDWQLYSKKELIGYMVSCLNLTESDIVLLDGVKPEAARAILPNAAPAKIGVVIHAQHFWEEGTDENNILWNCQYEYVFSQHKHIHFYMMSTDAQSRLFKEQFQKYKNAAPVVAVIPVGSLSERKAPANPRKRHSLITASRLRPEKYVDFVIEAVAEARKQIPDLTLDIYGSGTEEIKLWELMTRLSCCDYVRLRGHRNLDDVYQNYEAYISASAIETFGLTLMEAIGSGLAVIGFDVPYGNQNFIDDEKNGYKIPVNHGNRIFVEENEEREKRIQSLADRIVRLFTQADLEAFRRHSYKKAKQYLAKEVEYKWNEFINQMI